MIALSKEKLTLVTLTRDNSDELELTLKSVSRQTIQPSRHLVIDGSAPDSAVVAKALATKYAADYHWKAPEGIYPAMDYSMSFVDDDDYVLWLNSSDWLIGPNVLEEIFREIALRPLWISGRVAQRDARGVKITRAFKDSADFRKSLFLGRTGFPHPATVMRGQVVREAGGFREGGSYSIARDYDLALRVIQSVGPPKIVPILISVHVTTGLSGQHQIRNYFERLSSRLRRVPWTFKVGTVFLSPTFLAIAIARRFGLSLSKGGELSELNAASLQHFCDSESWAEWPQCCDEVLQVSRAYPELV